MKEKFYILIFILFFSNLIFGQKAKLNISIDDRIETLYSVAYFDNYFLVNKHANIYKNTLDQKLTSLKNHRAVALLIQFLKNIIFHIIDLLNGYSNIQTFQNLKRLKPNQMLKMKLSPKEKNTYLKSLEMN